MKSTKGPLTINNEISKTIVQICFEVRELKVEYKSSQIVAIKEAIECDEKIGKSIDNLLGSGNNKELIGNITIATNHVKNLIEFYKTTKLDLDNKLQLITVLQRLESKLFILQEETQKAKN